MSINTPTKFKETEIGLIPEEWGFSSLGNHCKILGGKRLPKEDSLVNQKTDHPYIRITDLGDFGVNESGLKYISDETHAKIKKYIIESGDIYISNVGTIGLVGLVKDNLSGANLTENAVRLTKLEGLDNLFLGYYLKSESGQNQIRQNTVGAVQPKLPIYGIENIKLPIPELIEQKEIAEILSSLDDKINLNQRISENLEKLAGSLFKKWFIDIGDELPEGWRMGKFSEIAEITSGKRPIDNQDTQTNEFKIPLLGASSVMGYVKEALYNEPILVTGRVGTHGIIQKVDYPCWPSDNTLIIKSKYLEFAYQTMRSFDFASLNRGSTQPLITQGDLKNIEIRVPIETLLKEFETAVAPFAELVRDNEKENYNLSQIRDSLLPRLMSGKIRV